MEKNSKIYIAGHLGLVGSALNRKLRSKGYVNIIGRSLEELDLTDQKATEQFFNKEKPEYVFLAAAKVGGIIANNTRRAEFIYDNLQIQNNIIHQAYLNGVKKLLFLGSSCIYPRKAPQPISENSLLTSELEYTNEPYSIAKIAGIKLCESYNIQYGTNFISVMPTNLYGPNDNYNLETSHVLPAIIRKMHLGKCLSDKQWDLIRKDLDARPIEGVDGKFSDKEIRQILSKYGISTKGSKVALELWGTGSPRREFLHSDDMADACVFLMENIDFKDLIQSKQIINTHINIGSGIDLTIKELAKMIQGITSFPDETVWDNSKPDGTFQKLLDVSKLKSFGWMHKIPLEKGISEVYKNYLMY
jgi:GDP-L-fucose synthase